MLRIRPAAPDDADTVHGFIVALHVEQRFPGELVATTADLTAALFGAHPVVEAVLAEIDGAAVGFAIFGSTYSTVLGRPGIHLEDLYVRPAHRDAGVGRALLAHLAREVVDRGGSRLEWWVLRTNDRARGLYRRVGARQLDEIDALRVDGEALRALAGSEPG